MTIRRLLTAQRGPDTNIQRKYSYDYDRYGNRWGQILNDGTGYNTSHSFNASNNRVTTTGFSGVYPERSRRDTSGNQTNTNAGMTFAYNQENLLTTAGASVSYAYDAQNRRKRKTVSRATTHYFYASGGTQAGFPPRPGSGQAHTPSMERLRRTSFRHG